MDLVTYLGFDGQCEAAFKHYEKVLGGKILMMMRYSDGPNVNPVHDPSCDRTYHYCMRAPDCRDMWGRQVYREITPPVHSDGASGADAAPARIVLVNSFSDETGGLTRHPMAPTWPIEMLSTFTFTEAGPGKTTFTVTWLPLHPTLEERATFDAGHAGMTGGWRGTMEQLAAYLFTARS